MAESEGNPLLILPQEAKDFFVHEFGAEASSWEPRLAPLFHSKLFLWKQLYRQVHQELEAIETALKALKKATKALHGWPDVHAQVLAFPTTLSEINPGVSDAIKALEAAKEERRGIRRSVAPRGNRDKGAHVFAEMVAQIIAYHGEPVTFGQDQFGEPTTRYGRIVRYGLAFHGIDSHWRRPAEQGYRKARQGFPNNPFTNVGPNTKRE